MAPAQILSDIGEFDRHRRLEVTSVELLSRDGFVDIPERFEARHVLTLSERRAFALKSCAGDKHSNGRVAIHHRKVNAAPVFEAGKSDMIERHVLIRRCVNIDDESRQMTITVEQIKEARKLLGWSQFRLAVRSTVDVTQINHFERGMRALTHSQLDQIRSSIESSGVEFIVENGGGSGVRLRKDE